MKRALLQFEEDGAFPDQKGLKKGWLGGDNVLRLIVLVMICCGEGAKFHCCSWGSCFCWISILLLVVLLGLKFVIGVNYLDSTMAGRMYPKRTRFGIGCGYICLGQIYTDLYIMDRL